MKILMVNKFLFPNGGSETYIFKLGECLTAAGHEVQYFGMEHPDRRVGNSAGIYTSNMDFHNAGALSKIRYSLKTIYSAEARKKMLAVLNDFRPDVVHLNNFNYQLTPSIIYAVKDYEKSTGMRPELVYTAHDYQLICPNHMMYSQGDVCVKCIENGFLSCIKNKCIHDSMPRSIAGAAEAALYNATGIYSRIDTIICCSRFMKSMLDTNDALKSKTVALHNFIENIERKKSKKSDYILYFGRYSREKGISVLIKAAEKSGYNIICAGTGPMEDEINKAPSIKNVGFKSGAELEELIRCAACTVTPSIWYENCPFSVMESISYGTPVAGADIGGIPELIKDGKTGCIFKPGDADDLIDKVTMMMNPLRRDEMAASCLAEHFDTVDEYCKKLISIYKREYINKYNA